MPDTSTGTCPVCGIITGPCGDPVTHRVEITCDHGCQREPFNVCEYDAAVLREGDDMTFCVLCRDAGREDVHVRLVSITPIGAEETTDA
jgi:hypothetical protein